jgi:TPP-dependent 2-oxoacid decarboxylase
MSSPISHTQVYLDDPTTAPTEIDRALANSFVNTRPVYLMLPTDMVPKEVSSEVVHIGIGNN